MVDLTNIFIYSENVNTILSLSRFVRMKADVICAEINTVLINDKTSNHDEYFDAGVDRIYRINSELVNDYSFKQYQFIMNKTIAESNSNIILFSATKRGTELASSIAAMLNTGCMSNCVDLNISDDGLEIKKYVFGGSVISEQISKGKIHVATVIPGTQVDEIRASNIRELIDINVDIPADKIIIKERKIKKKTVSNLENAKVIVSAGRGFKKQDDIRLLEELASVLDANVGCTRPIAADNKWFEEWIGISGQKVAPELYLACGISGTIQHLSGIRESKVIISINNDPSASIHNYSDYSIVADLYHILPDLTRALRGK